MPYPVALQNINEMSQTSASTYKLFVSCKLNPLKCVTSREQVKGNRVIDSYFKNGLKKNEGGGDDIQERNFCGSDGSSGSSGSKADNKVFATKRLKSEILAVF